MSDRLPTHLLISALLRRVNDAGGMGMVVARGDAQAGTILLILNDKGQFTGLIEPGRDTLGRLALVPVGPAESAATGEVAAYWQRRRSRDPDLWVVDLDIPFAQQVAAEVLL